MGNFESVPLNVSYLTSGVGGFPFYLVLLSICICICICESLAELLDFSLISALLGWLSSYSAVVL